MKAKLEFNLEDIDDEFAYLRCVKAKDMALVLWDIDQAIREWSKKDKTTILIDEVRSRVNLICNSYNINLDELIN